MATRLVRDQTDENTGTIVTDDMFGLNALITVNTQEDHLLQQRMDELGASNLRYPGGSVTEWYFDISDISGGSHERTSGSFQGIESALTPLSEFLELAGNLETDVTLVVPTINGFTQSAGEALLEGSYGQRTLDAEHLTHVGDFVAAALEMAAEQGVRISALEIGNEFWGSGQMTASEYGMLASAISAVIADKLDVLGIEEAEQPDIVVQTISSAGTFSPSRDTTLLVDEATQFVYKPHHLDDQTDAFVASLTEVAILSQGNARAQLREIIAAFERDSITVEDASGQRFELDNSLAANTIDGVVDHFYLDGGFDAVNTEEQYGFNQLELWNLELGARDDDFPDLDFYITEWNTRKNTAPDEGNNRGLQQVSMSVEILYEMVTHDVTAAHFWPAIFDQSNSGTLIFKSADSLTLAGEGFALMSESLVGLAPVLDFRVSGEIAIHGYADTDTHVYFLSERSGAENRMVLDLSEAIELDADYYRVSWTELWDGGAGGSDGLAQPVTSTTQIVGPVTAEAFNELMLTMQAWSVVRMDIQGIDAADAGNAPTIGSGPHARHVEGSAFGDHLRGGLGNDTILGGEGDDILYGNDGNDILKGDWGDDELWGGAGIDRLIGGNAPTIGSGPHARHVEGSAFGDRLRGGLGNDTIRGGEGDDNLNGYEGRDLVYGGTGDDIVKGGWGDDILYGNDGNDILKGDWGDDQLWGGAGIDRLIGGDGADTFAGSLSDLNGDTIVDFSADDRILITGRTLDASDVQIGDDGSTLDIDLDNDGNRDAFIIVEGGYHQDRLSINTENGDTILSFPQDADEDEADATVEIAVQVLDRAGKALNDATVTFTPYGEDAISEDTDATGGLDLTLASGQPGYLDVTREYDHARDGQITVGDALNVLRLAVGLEPSWGEADALDILAADFNQDGEVGVSDALEVLRVAVGLETEHDPRWIFFDSGTDLSGVDCTNSTVNSGFAIGDVNDYPDDVSMTGVLLGDVWGYV